DGGSALSFEASRINVGSPAAASRCARYTCGDGSSSAAGTRSDSTSRVTIPRLRGLPGPIDVRFLSADDVERIALRPDEIIAAIDDVVRAQGDGAVVLEPRVHLVPGAHFSGHWNVLRAYVAPLETAGVKVV